MAGRLSISFLLSTEASPTVPPLHDEPQTSFPKVDSPVSDRPPPLLLAQSQLLSNSRPVAFDSRTLGSQHYAMSDSDPPRSPRSNQSSRSYEISQRLGHDQHHFQAVSTSSSHLLPSSSTQRHPSFSPPFAYARLPSSGSPVSYVSPSGYDIQRSPITSHHTLPPLQPSPRFHASPSPYIYSQGNNRPSSSREGYANPTHFPFDLRSRSRSDPDPNPFAQGRPIAEFPVSYRPRRPPSPLPQSESHPTGMSRGLEALVQAATQERRRLGNDYSNLQETSHSTAYSDRSLSTPVCGTTYSPEFRGNLATELPREKQQSADLDVQAPRALDVAAAQEIFTQDRRSFMRISHIASDYRPARHVSPVHVANDQPYDLVSMTESLDDDPGDRSVSRASSAPPPPTDSEPDTHALEGLGHAVPIIEGTPSQEQSPSIPSGEADGKFLGYNSDGGYSKHETRYVSSLSQPSVVTTEAFELPPAPIQPYETETSSTQAASELSTNPEQHRSTPVTPATAEIDAEVASRPDADNDEMTVDMEFDLAASKSENGFDMDIDVEDELLRLVDDEPSHGQRESRESWRRSPNTPITDILLDMEAPPPTSVQPALATTESAVAQQHPSESSGSKKSTKGASSRKKQPVGKTHTKAKQPAKRKSGTKAKNTVLQHVDPISVSYTASGRMTKQSAPPFPLSLTNTKLSGSRPTSVMPTETEQAEKQVDQDDDKENMDDKVYCVCRSQYEEGKVMIACDRCDEWYHMQCLAMADLEVDLVDQFICPICVENNPHLSLGTTYKQRCLAGLKHPNPSSPNACYKPARGAFSKYCSEECGINYMRTKIDTWAANGGNKAKLWDQVKDADQREGVVIAVNDSEVKAEVKMEVMELGSALAAPVLPGLNKQPRMTKQKERELDRLRTQLDSVAQLRDVMKSEMEIILWRVTLTQLASERSEGLDECGWDQRLCMDDEDYAEVGASVQESYGSDDQNTTPEVDGEWWCRGKKKCDRHAGWQKLRSAEVSFEREVKETALSNLAAREREIRKRIEDITDPQQHISVEGGVSGSQLNGRGGRTKINGSMVKTGRKRKTAG